MIHFVESEFCVDIHGDYDWFKLTSKYDYLVRKNALMEKERKKRKK